MHVDAPLADEAPRICGARPPRWSAVVVGHVYVIISAVELPIMVVRGLSGDTVGGKLVACMVLPAIVSLCPA